MKVTTWNVRSLNVEGKLENVILEMKRSNIDLLGVSETHWEKCDDFVNDGYRIIAPGGKKKRNGVAIILNQNCVAK